MTQFIHLKVHSEFSLVDGLVRIPQLMSAVAELAMPAVALTDVSNFYALIKAYKAAQSAGIKLIVGADFWMEDPHDKERPSPLTLLALDDTGYNNLTLLISRAWQHGQYHGQARVQRTWLDQYSDGLICLSGGRTGAIGQLLLCGHQEEARQTIDSMMSTFADRFYLELQRTGREGEEDYIHAAIELAGAAQCPVVATNDVRFLQSDEFEAHEARVCIGDGRILDDPRRKRSYSEQQYLRSPDEMAELFSDIPEAIDNTVAIARRCSVNIRLGEPLFAKLPCP